MRVFQRKIPWKRVVYSTEQFTEIERPEKIIIEYLDDKII